MTPAPDSAQPKLASERWVRDSYPEWSALLADLAGSKRYPRPAEKVHAAMPNGGACVGVERVTSYEELKAGLCTGTLFECGDMRGFGKRTK